MPKIIRILRSCSMKIFSTFPIINISLNNYWLVICIAKNFILTTLKMIFSIFRCFCTPRFQIFKYCPNHTTMEILFIQLSDETMAIIHRSWSNTYTLSQLNCFCGNGSRRREILQLISIMCAEEFQNWFEPLHYLTAGLKCNNFHQNNPELRDTD